MKNWISPNNNIKAELLYRLSRDGEKISKYHQLCDNIRNIQLQLRQKII